MIKEEWKIYIFSGLEYKVSNTGKVIGLGRNRELKQREDSDGYMRVTLGNANCRKSFRVHRLVATLFVNNPDPQNKVEVNHIDLNRSNNIYTNLEWTTHKENISHSKKLGSYVGRFGSDNPNYGNNTLKEKYKNNKELSIEKNSRKGSVNGMSKKVALYDKNGFVSEFEYIGECCEYIKDKLQLTTKINTIRTNIVKSTKQGKKYRGFYIVFI